MRKLQHVVRSQQFDRELLEQIFADADLIKNNISIYGNILSGKVMATLFYEPSTRTRLSFESAMSRLGGKVISTESAKDFSSASKGETLEDTIRIVNGYADVIVLRHYEAGASNKAEAVSRVPIVNAGDGPGQHPTQALLDLYTIKEKIGFIDGLTIGFVGDLANGRTVRSLSYLLSKFKVKMIYFIAPDVVKIGQDIKNHLDEHNIPYKEMEEIDEAISIVDVLYVTRIQEERFGDRPEDFKKAFGKYIIDSATADRMKEDAIIMHPLPRINEITTDVDTNKRAYYFQEAQNGLYVRMAVIKMLLT